MIFIVKNKNVDRSLDSLLVDPKDSVMLRVGRLPKHLLRYLKLVNVGIIL